MKKFSKWFPASISPARPGFYEADRLEHFRHEGATRRIRRVLFWTGAQWRYTATDAYVMAGNLALLLLAEGDKWRGLRENPGYAPLLRKFLK